LHTVAFSTGKVDNDQQIDVRARGWMPLAARVGNVLIVPIDESLAWRLGEVWSIDPWAPLSVASAVESGIREYVDEKLPETTVPDPE
jgi:hypothetical protein